MFPPPLDAADWRVCSLRRRAGAFTLLGVLGCHDMGTTVTTPQLSGPMRLEAISAGALSSRGHLPSCSQGAAAFLRNGKHLDPRAQYCSYGRGFTVAEIDTATGNLVGPVKAFDIWGEMWSGLQSPPAAGPMLHYLTSIPNGMLIMIAVNDEAGLNHGGRGGDDVSFCEPLRRPVIDSLVVVLRALGSERIDEYCYQGSFALAAVKGAGVALDEKLGRRGAPPVSAIATLPIYGVQK
jgi:hypothetical protein